MKSPEEIRSGLEHCQDGAPCEGCPYWADDETICCANYLKHDLFVYIQQIHQLEEKATPRKCTHEATRHRDFTCPVCKNVVSRTVEVFGNKLEAITNYCPFCGQRIETEEAENEVEQSSEIWLDALC